MRRRRRSRRGARLLGVLLLPAVAIAALLLLARGTSTEPSQPPPAAGGAPKTIRKEVEHTKPSGHQPPPGISLFAAQPVHIRFKHPPRGGILFDLKTGQVLWAHNPLQRLPIASTTKIMTAILVTERTKPTDKVPVTHEALAYSGSGVGVLPKKKKVPVEALLAGMLLPSGNDAAIALADFVSGHAANFAKLMNRRARTMRLGCTHYISPDGLETANRSCAADLAALARVAMSQPRIAHLVRLKQAHVRFPIKTGRLWLNSTNPLLRMGYPGTIGLKTGFTDKAGHCFVAVVRRGNRTYGVVLLHSPNTLKQSQKLFDAAFKLR
jgi:D-alanyl-D-alanine carboxypeptidase